MITYTERLPYTGSPEYDKHFWNAMRGNNGSYAELSKARNIETGTYAMPNTANNKYMAALQKKACSAILVRLSRHTTLATVYSPRTVMTLPSGYRKVMPSQYTRV